MPESVEGFCKLREDTQIMTLFVDRFLPCVVGKNAMKRDKYKMTISEIASVSDEAFALLVLDHIWERWMGKDIDLYKKLKTTKPVPGNKDDKEARKPAVGKYTHEYHKAGRCKGWKPEGLRKFIELCERVKEDRTKDNGAFEESYLAARKKEVEDNKTVIKKPQPEEEEDEVVVAIDMT